MEKVRLTKEQAEVIEDIKGTMHLNLEANLKEQINKEWYGYPFGSLNKLTTKQFLDALYIGYEVEPEIKVGDFVDIGLFGISKIAEVTGVKGDTIAINGSEEYQEFKINRVLTNEEKQEEKQRRWWAKHGREVWELKQGDILKDKRNGFLYEYQGIGDAFLGETIRLAEYNEGQFDFYDFWKNDVTKHFVVVVFAEDRKDVDNDN